MTHWSVDFYDRAEYVSAQTLLANEDAFPGRVTRDPLTGVISEIDLRQVNLAAMSAAGIDTDLVKYWDTQFGGIQASFAATYTYKHDDQISKDSPVTNGVAQHNLQSWAPRWKIIPRLAWTFRGVAASLTGRYISSYKDSVALQIGPDAGSKKRLGDFWLVDMNWDLPIGKLAREASFFSGSTVNLGVTNILDELPEFCAGCGSRGYDTSQYDIIGRKLYAEFRLTF
jgi:hypothetical protein